MSGALHVAGLVHRGGFDLDVSVDVAAGEVLVVLGPNGAGKTTLLRTVAGLAPLTSGSIRLGATTLDDVAAGIHLPPERRPVALVFQDYRLFPHLSVLDNVAFAPAATGLSRADARERAQAVLDRLDLAHLAGRRPHEVSGGQAQRVALARALASQPGALLMDEPLAALDTRTRLEVRTELRRYLRAFEGPVVVVTHDALEAMVLADRILVLENGRVVQVGHPTEVARRPGTDYVARLVGLNLYAGVLDAGQGVVDLDGGGRLVVSRAAGAVAGGRVLVTLRPSAVTVHGAEPRGASPRNVWPGTVVDLEAVGDRVRLQVQGSPSALVDVTPGAVAELDLGPGRRVWLSAKATETEAYVDDATVPA